MYPSVRYGFGIFLLLFFTTVRAQVEIPELSHRVTDLTGTFNVQQAAALENRLAAFEAKKGSQIGVLIVPTTQSEDIAQFGIRVAEAWKIGRKNVDDGVILIVAKEDRKLRLEVGYGLEGAIPDAIAKRVIAETIKPYFKNGDYVGGIDAGVTQLMQLIEGETLPTHDEESNVQYDNVFMFIFVGGLIAGFVLSAFMGGVMGGMLAGLGTGAVVALFFGWSFAVGLIGFMIFMLAVIFDLARHSGGGGWSSGGGSGSWGGSSGGSSGSSWGGGGGGFGGGGASDSW
jgi:uncharacterized protein